MISPHINLLWLVIWALLISSYQASGFNNTKFECVAVEGTPEFKFVPVHSLIACSIQCAQSASCQLFIWNSTQEERCQFATTAPSGTTLTALYVAHDANVTTIPISSTDLFCPDDVSPELLYANTVTPEVIIADTVTPEVIYADTVTPEAITVTPVSVTTTRPFVNLGEGGSWSDCRDTCISEGVVMIPCPDTRDFLEEVAAEFGNTAKVYIYGFRAAYAADFLNPSGNVAIANGSSLWGTNQPDDRHEVDCGLYTVWRNVADTEDREFTNDLKVCVCW